MWRARRNNFNKPVIAIVGCLRADYEVVYEHGIDAVFPIIRNLGDLPTILKQGEQNLVSTAQKCGEIVVIEISFSY